MDPRTESIKQEIDATRTSMTTKMEQIESQVHGTVDNIKTSAQDTVDSVKESLNVKRMVNERPWTMLGASMLTGFVLGSLGGDSVEHHNYDDYNYDYDRARRRGYVRMDRYSDDDDQDEYYEEHPTIPVASDEYQQHDEHRAPQTKRRYTNNQRTHRRPSHSMMRRASSASSGLMSAVQKQFGDDIETLKTAAITTAINSLRNMLQNNLPQLAEEFEHARHEREQQHTEDTPHTYAANTAFAREAGGSTHLTHQNDVSSSIVAPVTASEK